MSKLTIEQIKEVALRHGIDITQTEEGEGGFFIHQPDGSTRRLSTDEMMESMFPGSISQMNE